MSIFVWGRVWPSQEDSITARAVLSTPGEVPVAGARQVCAGYKHTIVCTEEGQVLTWGSNADSQLGRAGRYLPREAQSGMKDDANLLSRSA